MSRPVSGHRGIYAALALGGCAGAVGAGFVFTVPVGYAGASVCAAAAGVAGLAAFGRRRASRFAVAATLVALGLLRGSIAADAIAAGGLAHHLGRRPVSLVGTVRPAPGGRLGGARVVVDVTRLSDGDGDIPVRAAILVGAAGAGGSAPVAPGVLVEVDAAGLGDPGSSGGAASANLLAREGVSAIALSPTMSPIAEGGANPAGVLAVARSRVAWVIDGALGEPAATLTLGIAFGLHRSLAADVSGPLQDAGLIHIVAVSGLKVVIVAALARTFARALNWPSRWANSACLVVVGGYVVLSGAGAAALRSSLMALVGALVRRDGRRADPLPMLALTAVAMLVIDPSLARDVGFQLSFLGTLGIATLAGPLAARLPGPRILVEPLTVTIAAQAMTFPITASTFGVVSLVGPVANALALPLLPILIPLGWTGTVVALLAPNWGPMALAPAGWGADVVLAIARAAAAMPGAAIHVAAWPPAATLMMLIPLAGIVVISGRGLTRRRRGLRSDGATRPHGRGWRGWRPAPPTTGIIIAMAVGAAAAGGAALLLLTGPSGRLRFTVLDLGGPPSVLVESPHGGTVLVNGGSDPGRLVSALGRRFGPTTTGIDLLVLTGDRQDVVAGLGGLVGRFHVRQVIVPGRPGPAAIRLFERLRQDGAEIVQTLGGEWTWGELTWTYNPVTDPVTGTASYPLAISSPAARVLIVGDVSPAMQEDLAARIIPGGGATDLLVSETGGAVAPALLAGVAPRYLAIPSSGRSNAAFAPPGVTLDRTGVEGDLTYVSGGDGLRREH